MRNLKLIESSPDERPALVDRIACLLFRTFDPTRPSARHWKELGGAQREKWRDMAKNLFVELEKPDASMIAAGANELNTGRLHDTRSNQAKAADVFMAMVCEALEG